MVRGVVVINNTCSLDTKMRYMRRYGNSAHFQFISYRSNVAENGKLTEQALRATLHQESTFPSVTIFF